jgi:hypothetical protein
MGILMFTNAPVLAVDVLQPVCETGTSTKFCKDVGANKNNDRILGADGLITKILQIVVYITGAISIIMIVIGGFKYVVSAGDSNGVQGAKNTVMYALIGLVISLFSQIIVSFVLTRL